jgi:hypothetical protein
MGMKNRKILALVVAGLCLVPAVPTFADNGPDGTVVGTDPTGDWGGESDLAPLGNELGQDLKQASIDMITKKTVTFKITVDSLPDLDPTFLGYYVWSFRIGKDRVGLVSCGNFVADCDARDHFVVITGCKIIPPKDEDPIGITSSVECDRLGEVAATYDSTAETISVPVTLSTLRIRRGSTLNMRNGFLLASPYVAYFDSDGRSDFDTMRTKGIFRIP